MGRYFILNDDHTVTDLGEDTAALICWGEAFERANRIVAKTQVAPGVEVSTVFLGIDMAWGGGPPLLFETMVFTDYGGEDCWRWPDWESAMDGHYQAVAKLVESLSPDIKKELDRLAGSPDVNGGGGPPNDPQPSKKPPPSP